MKKFKGLLILTVFLIIFMTSSFAWLNISIKGEKINILKAGDLSLILDETSSEGINIEGAVPVSDEKGLSQEGYTFKLVNNGTVAANYIITLDDLEIETSEERMSDDILKYSLTKNGVEGSNVFLPSIKVNNKRVVDRGVIDAKTTNTYTLKLWMDYDTTNEGMNKIFAAKLNVDVEQENIKVEKSDKTIDINNKTETLGLEEDISNYIVESSDEEVAVIDSLGNIVGKHHGTVVFKVRNKKTGAKKEISVTITKTLKATFVKQLGVENISKEEATCLLKEKEEKSCSITLPEITPEQGYTKVGWSTEKGSHTGTTSMIDISKDSNLYTIVKKDEIVYTATFNKQVTGVSQIESTTVSCTIPSVYNEEKQEESCKIKLPTVEMKEGYSFVGWNTKKDATTGYKGQEEIELDSNKEFYPIVKKDAIILTAKFYKNGADFLDGVQDEVITKTCILEEKYNGEVQDTECSITTPEIKAGSATPNVVGYSENKDAITSDIGSKTSLTLSSNKEYYAITKSDIKTYSARFYKNGAASLDEVQDEFVTRKCNIPSTYNGKVQKSSCRVTSPEIKASSKTPIVLGYSESMDNHTVILNSNTETNISSDVNYYAQTKKDKVIYTATFKVGKNVTSVEKESNTCTIEATYNGNVQGTSCSIEGPSITPKTGYTSVGWSTTNGSTTGSTSLELTENTTFYANATANSYTVEYYDGNTKLGSSGVKVDEELTLTTIAALNGEKSGYTFKGWAITEGSTQVVHNDGATVSNLSTTEGAKVNLYAVWKDETSPSCSWTTGETITTGNTTDLIMTCTDLGSGITSQTLTASNFVVSSSTYGSIMGVSSPIAVTNGYKYTVTVKGLSSGATQTTNGSFSVSLNAGVISDNAGNSNIKTTSSEVTVAGRKYTATYEKGSKVTEIGSTSGSCTSVGTSTSCSVTLPSITVATGYTASGWYNGTTKVGNANESYTLSSNVTLTAQANDTIAPSKPSITNTSNGEWAKSATVTITSTDAGSGIDHYEWYENGNWTTRAITVTNGVGTITYTAERNETIRFRAVDVAGNISEEATTTVKIDTTSPSCSITNTTVNYNETANVTLTCTDTASKIISKTLTTSNFSVSDATYGSVTAVSSPSEVTNGYKYTATVKGVAAGSFTLSLNSGVISDNAGNTNIKTTSGSITVNKVTASNPTLTAYSGTYDGTSHTITVNGGSGGTIQYSTDNATWSTTKPTRTDVGTTTVYVRVLGDSNHNTTTSISSTITITRKAITVPTCATKTYNGSTQTLFSSGTGYTAGGTTNATDAGTYTATATPTGNYKWSDDTTTSKNITCKIDPKSVTVSWGSTTTFTYNGSGQAPTASATSGITGETINVTRTTATAAGSYTSTASCSSVSGGRAKCSNYTLTGTTKTFTINRASMTIPSSPAAKNYTGSSQASGIACPSGSSAGGTTSATNAGTHTQTCTPDGNHQWSDGTTTAKSITWVINKVAATLTCSNKTYSGSNQTACSCSGGTIGGTNSATDVGTYTVSCTPDSNHTAPSNKTWSITAKSVAVSWGTTTTFTYNGSGQAPSVSSVTGVSGETVNFTRTTATNAGSYTSTASCSSVSGGRAKCSNYTLTGTTKTFTINRASMTIPSSPAAKNYTGSSQASGITCPSGSSAGGTTSATNAGTHTQTCTPDANHQWSDGTTTAKSISWVINKVAATLTCSNKTYSGSSQTACSCSGGTIGGTYAVTDVGTYTASCTPDSNHTAPSNKSWTMSAKSVAVSWGTTTTFTYNGSGQAPSVSSVTGVSGETVNFTRTTATNAGSHTSTASCSSVSGGQAKCSNYTLTGTTKTFTINKATPTLTQSSTSGSATTANTTSYTIKSSVAGTYSASSANTSYATVSLSSTSTISANSAVTATVKAVSVNSSAIIITVKFTPSDTTNYNSTSKTYSFTPKARTYTITYSKGTGVSSIGSTSASFTTVGSATRCTFTSSGSTTCTPTSGNLPSITSSSGYTVAGWYNGTTKIGDAGDKFYSISGFTISRNITLTAKAVQTTTTFSYTGGSQTYTAPVKGTYKLEVWGAQGGSISQFGYFGGYGSYSIGNVILEQSKKIYITVGEVGHGDCVTSNCIGGYNGGGDTIYFTGDSLNYIAGGGGATHIATQSGLLSTLENSKESILIVAGGGGGAYYHSNGSEFSSNGGSAGGYIGVAGLQVEYTTSFPAYGGTQSSGGIAGYRGENGKFGKGGSGYGGVTQTASGGGGGYYGGGSAAHSGTGGGSGYIGNSLLTSKKMYCYNCEESSEESTKTISTTCASSTPTEKCAKEGNGYAKITLISID